ncbi:MAG TPA: hypothetical protein VJ722_02400 [Rhodanobacteraceae bacterium]|nr:hypothetical protein [Rhodanobacteraceae bacterium]
MRLNRAIWHGALRRMRAGCPDPRELLDADISPQKFTEVIAAVKIDGVFKTTSARRYPETTRLLADMRFASPPVIVDVGASDGSTSLDVIETMKFSRYYVTDRYIEAHACSTENGVFFSDADFIPFMYANRFFVVYNDARQAAWPFSWLVTRLFSRFDASKCRKTQRLRLVNPRLVSRLGDGVIRLERYSIFEEWPFEKADLVIAANILNRGYFSDAELAGALRNLRSSMRESARLAIIENRPAEQSSIFRLEGGRFVLEREVGAGSDIKPLVVSLS